MEPATFKQISEWFKSFAESNETKANELELVHLARSGCESIERDDGELTDWYNFSGDFDQRVFIRQTKKGRAFRASLIFLVMIIQESILLQVAWDG